MRFPPAPERILETETVHELLNSGTLVICAGGEASPSPPDHVTGAVTGVEAVVDKDLTAAMPAADFKADFLLVLTDVPCVHAGYDTPYRRPVRRRTNRPRLLSHDGWSCLPSP